MRKEAYLLITIFSLCFPPLVSADQASFTPEKSRIGETITIVYKSTDSAAVLKSAQSISCEVLLLLKDSSPEIIDLPLIKSGEYWKGTLKVANEKSVYLMFRFAADDLVDNNKSAYWEILINGKDEKPVEGALQARAQSILYPFGTFAKERNLENAKNDIKVELQSYPDNIGAVLTEWTLMMMESKGAESIDAIRKRLQQVYESYKNDETAVGKLLPWFDRTGQKEKADDLRSSWVKKNPKGPTAQSVRETEIGTARDIKQRAELVEKYLEDFSLEPQQLQNFQTILVSTYLRAMMFDKALAFVEKLKNPDPKIFNSIAWTLIEKGEHLDIAVDYAQKAVSAVRNPAPSTKPMNRSIREWKKSLPEQLAMILDTYGYGLFKTGKTVDAQAAYEESYALNEDIDADGISRIVDCYRANAVYDKAIELSEKAIVQRKSDDILITKFKDMYIQKNGSEKGFDERLASLQSTAKLELRAKLLKHRLNTPSIDFLLKGIDGSTVRLSELKGKVVVLDFWATWCGPCVSSFPTLQRVYDRYKTNDKVAILALNTWERVQGADREKAVKDFLTKNKYTFPVLYDEYFVSKYGVEGIPTKFLIDKNGLIQFKSVGFEGSAAMFDELTIQLEILLGEDFDRQ